MGRPMPPGLRPQRPPEWAVPCPVPTCKGRPGSPCTGLRGRIKADVHPSRYDAWIVQQNAA
ncbi:MULTISPECIES: zinc finger domain-containing protein [unclassified Kitasatospora]|uniref:zinc finger domain-containing protein n=1 Tax=unclassified Kitasatospora TaxID=2633591 RepID=UPI003D030D89